jgi:hypothetical protein
MSLPLGSRAGGAIRPEAQAFGQALKADLTIGLFSFWIR